MDTENEFFIHKLELDYGNKKAVKELKKLSNDIAWLKGWPNNKAAFWNGEAFMWSNKISQEKRKLITKELKPLEKKKNLDLGCGAYSYTPSTGFDISEKMLLLNDKLKERITGDLEKALPFEDESFDSATLVFVLNYVKNHESLLKEVFRVLKKKGSLIVVQSSKQVDKWHRRQAVNNCSFKRLNGLLNQTGFKVKSYEKEELWFFKCRK